MKNVVVSAGLEINKYKKIVFRYDQETLTMLNKLKLSIQPISLSKKINYNKFKNSDGLFLMGNGDIFKIKRTKVNFLRDNLERKLFKYFYKKNKPIIAICRGFQNIMDLYKIPLIKTKGHVRTSHNLNIKNSRFLNYKKLIVNSYHNYCLDSLPKNYSIISKHTDKKIEIAEHKTKKFFF